MTLEEKENYMQDMIKEEVQNLISEHDWIWDKNDECFYTNDAESLDMADIVYYYGDDYIIHPKVLAAYATENLKIKYIEELIKNIKIVGTKAIKCFERYYEGEFLYEEHIYKIKSENCFKLNFREIKKTLSENYGANIEVVELNRDEEGEFAVIKILT